MGLKWPGETMSKFDCADFLEKVIKENRYACINDVICEWTGNHWQAISDKRGEAFVLGWLQEHHPDQVSHSVIRQAWKTLKLALLNAEHEVNSTEIVVPCVGTYIHIEDSGAITTKPPLKEEFCTYALKCAYDPAATAPMFEGFLAEVLPDEAVRSRVQEYIGYTLVNDCRYHRAALWLGSGANGKGVLSNIVQALHKEVQAIQLDNTSRFALSGLMGASLLVADELPARRLDEEKLKSVIAGEPVYIDIKGQSPVTCRVQGKLLVLGNNYPIVDDSSEGFWRRWDIVPFRVTIPPERRDVTLARKIIECELAGVLNWALAGLQRLLGRGDFSTALPLEMELTMKTARAVADDVTGWLSERVERVNGPLTTQKSQVYADYKTWCQENDFLPKPTQGFWLKLKRSRTDLVAKKARIPGLGLQNACSLVLKPAQGVEEASNGCEFSIAA
jgi:putative DNA primase/helicase